MCRKLKLSISSPIISLVQATPVQNLSTVFIAGEMVIQSYKYDVQFVSKSLFEVRMTVIVRNLQKEDAGSYRCIAKNSLGEVESNIRLYEIPGPTRVYSLSLDEEDYNEQFGSAEREQDEELSNSVVERGRAMSHTTPGAPRGTLTNTHENHVPVDPAPSCSSGLLPMLASLLLLLLRI
ncbi:hypothetical protein GEV33_004309 [Tenebrio molitor]|uniref:Immunoglobulin I-set domain-containing protein n=1 Tax=Tenebrio molitor TaxID=7067 RepID=A0A8J6LGF8_TENMO|nr:hypothetical protein GEV33_004309 [Tenebrio molitor]